MARTQCFYCCGCGFNPHLGNIDPTSYVAWPNGKKNNKKEKGINRERGFAQT